MTPPISSGTIGVIRSATLGRFAAAAAVVGALPRDAGEYAALTEGELLEANRLFAKSLVALRAAGAVIAGEIAHRSAPSLGSEGLAQRAGHRTPEQFVKVVTGVTGREAVTAVRVGTLLRDAGLAGGADPVTGEVAQPPTQPWLMPVAEAVRDRVVSVDAAEAIRAGLGVPNSAVTVEQLTAAAVDLVGGARVLGPDALARQARALRDELDVGGVALREAERRQKRSLRLFVQADGTTRLVWVMDPETAATVRDLYDRAVSPKLGGVRFVDPDRQAIAEEIMADERTAEQVASDRFTQLLTLGADADPRFLLGSGAPVIRITTTRTAIETGRGIARIEGQDAPVSVATAGRLTCGGGTTDVVFDESGRVLDFGREQRFFTRKQKHALALMWGGCAAPGCERPASWCEAHHIVAWARDHGRTDLADGILFCRHHHLLFHNNGWEIRRDPDTIYWLIPPVEQDPNRTPIQLRSTSAALRDLEREHVAS
jgi:hypothetical protein